MINEGQSNKSVTTTNVDSRLITDIRVHSTTKSFLIRFLIARERAQPRYKLAERLQRNAVPLDVILLPE